MTTVSKAGLKNRLWKNLLRTHPLIILRVTVVWVLLSPWFIVSLLLSSIKASRLSKIENCRDFIRRHPASFPGVDPESLLTESLSGGVSNSNHLWHCRKSNGAKITYFVKAFVPIGTFWAKNLSLVSPFPKVDKITSKGRFQADITSRLFFTERGIGVPKMIAADEKEQRLVTEYLEGGNFDSILRESGLSGSLSEKVKTMVGECGTTLGKIHEAGYSLVDSQPINCIAAADGHVYFTDLEFCTRTDRKTWDTAFFLCFLGIRLKDELGRSAVKLFMEAYGKETALPPEKELQKINAELKPYVPTFKTILKVRSYRPEELVGEILRQEV